MSPAQPSVTPAVHVETSGQSAAPTEQRQLTPEELQWVANMRRLLGIEALEQRLMQNGGTSTPYVQNGHQNGGGGWNETLNKIADVAGKIIEKIPANLLGGGGEDGSLMKQFAYRYMNLLDTAYGRYIPPAGQPGANIQHVVVP